MLRAKRIPPLLNRICTDGIHLVLLITNDGELLGCSDQSSSSSSPNQLQEKLSGMDLSSIGALVSEVIWDYRRMGQELQLLYGSSSNRRSSASPAASSNLNGPSSGNSGSTGSDSGKGLKCLLVELELGLIGIASAASIPTSSSGATRSPSPPSSSSVDGRMGGSMIGGSINSDNNCCYVIAIADTNVEYGMMKARLVALAGYVSESLSQLAEQP
mmetsp:Transcript_55463/g.64857  ORF Transcript_55463/g.64857 Transcript_55463/m.64857 type:complete len:215 (-) Transcript_55463:458-1102(-)|eukprot:CAMPEP_0171317274 /NCGR_PEP_ID=MMETSP0816-20121228/79590_1 /TAXON_ID=420281 /ORGANISM="Proboscia inermis, Strain CCAP1064/1" /LENGTH=214 /DNA_ID=CAMNT_0011810373 /DNA_START=57 /DNA_END=701 /DNA_ORIENTATION=-